MLVLSRRSGESIIINDNIELKIVEIKGDYVKLGITAPRTIPVHRKEIFEAIQRENSKASQSTNEHVTELERHLPQDQSKQNTGGDSSDRKPKKNNPPA